MKLAISKPFTNVKTAIFAVSDSLNYHIDRNILKEMNVPKLSDQIVSATRRQYGDQFTKTNLESILNQTMKNMSATVSKAIKDKAKENGKEQPLVSDEDMKIINAPDNHLTDTHKPDYISFNEKIRKLPHLHKNVALLVKLLGRNRQRVYNAIEKARAKTAV